MQRHFQKSPGLPHVLPVQGECLYTAADRLPKVWEVPLPAARVLPDLRDSPVVRAPLSPKDPGVVQVPLIQRESLDLKVIPASPDLTESRHFQGPLAPPDLKVPLLLRNSRILKNPPGLFLQMPLPERDFPVLPEFLLSHFLRLAAPDSDLLL